VTEDLDLLSTKVNNQISPLASGDSMLFMIKNRETLIPNLSLHLFSDQDVDGGCIFKEKEIKENKDILISLQEISIRHI
jgi:hypothetical protein